MSQVTDDIHDCMDSYLNLMDNNISGMTEFLADSLSGDALAGLGRSQNAFSEYRRQNCLWYLEFSSPRAEAELIAKNCLANMSRQRWQELQDLVSEEDTSAQTVSGFFIYGAGKNSFQQCGSDVRYWVDGDPSVVNDAQQLYLSLATSEYQIVHAVFAATIDEVSEAPEGHQGLLKLTTLIDMSLPTESDCRLPSTQSAFALASGAEVDENALRSSDELEGDEEQDEPQQQLIAYFGAWLVDCTEINGAKSCELNVAFEKVGAPDELNDGQLTIVREKQKRTHLELSFPGREIDSPTLIRWRIDAFTFGDLVGSSILVDDVAARQVVPDGRFLKNDLLPLMIEGIELSVDVLEDVDDASGEQYQGTLNGLTKAIAFADDFVRDTQ